MFSAVIIAKNEARTIKDVIIAVQKVTDDIIVILDDRSDDDTFLIASSLRARVFKKKWEGYSNNKNYGATQAKYDWILCPDADEVMNEELLKSLHNLSPDIKSVYEMNIRTWFGNYPVKYCGWFPDWNIRLYNRTVMNWDGSYVHEKLTSEKSLTHHKLPGIIEHYSFSDETHMQAKFDYYAQMRANEWKKAGKTPSLIKRWFGPAFRFFRTYILKKGILDGEVGYIIAKNEYFLKKKELTYFFAN